MTIGRPGRGPARRGAGLIAVCALLVASAACTGSDGSAGPADETSSAAASADGSPAAEPRDLSDGRVFDLPDGRIQVVEVLRDPEGSSREGSGGVVFGDDVALLLSGTSLLTALDLPSGDVRWSTRLPRHGGEAHQPCALPAIAPGATVAAVLVGSRCGISHRVDLRTGKVLETVELYDPDDLPGIAGPVTLDGTTYWVDAKGDLNRFDADGRPAPVLTAAELGIADYTRWYVVDMAHLVGTDVLVLQADDTMAPGGPVGRWLGVRVGADATAELLWTQPIDRALEQAQPPGRRVPDEMAFGADYGGQVLSLVRRDINHPRLSRFDPETGELSTGLVLERDPAGGLPAWTDPMLGSPYLMPREDGMISPSGAGGYAGWGNLTYYDFTTGRIRWSWSPAKKAEITPPAADPLGMSEDGQRVYVRSSADFEGQILELDVEDGTPGRRWRLPVDTAGGLDLDEGTLHVHDDLVVWLRTFASSVSDKYAAVLRVRS